MAKVSGDLEADSGTFSPSLTDGGAPEEDLDPDKIAPTASATPSTTTPAPAPAPAPTPTAKTSKTSYDSETNSFRCERCDSFEAPSRSALTAHMALCPPPAPDNDPDTEPPNPPPDHRIHRKMFECDVCNMKFSNGANMRRHKMRHTGVKPYECRVCQKRFFRKDHLAEHFTTHTKTLPYHCPICNRGFQRQIAMRAHFQNEHVGQHDLVKSCPLCSYRAGSMKSLRVHFFNRHGIDLDNPGPAGSSASLLAAAGHMSSMDNTLSSLSSLSVSVAANYSDSGDSTGARSADNATPPMHFLTPHVEISMADAPASFSPIQCDQQRPHHSTDPNSDPNSSHQNGDSPCSPHSADSNSNAPSSSHPPTSMRLDTETNITPSISLIPIKQEPHSDEPFDKHRPNTHTTPVNLSTSPSGSIQLQTATSSSLSSLIKVSPLKSLLREDLKRKIVSRNSANRGRATASPNANPESSLGDSMTATNGVMVITSTGPEQPSESAGWRAKRGPAGLQCVFCGIGFPDQTLYFLHKGCHSDSNPWKCNICGEQCSNVYEFNSHLLSKSHQ